MNNRQSIRLQDYDYSSPGAYFVTVCVEGRECSLSTVKKSFIQLSNIGQIVQEEWSKLKERFLGIDLDQLVIMPNHIHGIIWIKNVGAGFPRPESLAQINCTIPVPGAGTAPLHKGGLGQIIGFYKYQTTKRINAGRNSAGRPFWQRNYYERVIRNEMELFETRKYITDNPLNWPADPENPDYWVYHANRMKEREFSWA